MSEASAAFDEAERAELLAIVGLAASVTSILVALRCNSPGANGQTGATGPIGPAGPAGPSPSGAANLFLATPDGGAGVSALRAIVAADIPVLPYDPSGSAAAAQAAAIAAASADATTKANAAQANAIVNRFVEFQPACFVVAEGGPSGSFGRLVSPAGAGSENSVSRFATSATMAGGVQRTMTVELDGALQAANSPLTFYFYDLLPGATFTIGAGRTTIGTMVTGEITKTFTFTPANGRFAWTCNVAGGVSLSRGGTVRIS